MFTTKKHHIIGHLRGEPSVTDAFPFQRASDGRSISIQWRFDVNATLDEYMCLYV